MPTRPPIFRQRKPVGATLVDLKRPSPSQRGYDSRWVAWREWFLNMVAVDDKDAKFEWQRFRSLSCQKCGETGSDNNPLELDHVIPLKRGGGKYDPNNIQILCKSCHSRKTVLEDGGLRHG